MQSSKSRYIGTLRTESENKSVDGNDAARHDEDDERGVAALGGELRGADQPEQVKYENDQRHLKGEAEAGSICTSKSMSDFAVHIVPNPR